MAELKKSKTDAKTTNDEDDGKKKKLSRSKKETDASSSTSDVKKTRDRAKTTNEKDTSKSMLGKLFTKKKKGAAKDAEVDKEPVKNGSEKVITEEKKPIEEKVETKTEEKIEEKTEQPMPQVEEQQSSTKGGKAEEDSNSKIAVEVTSSTETPKESSPIEENGSSKRASIETTDSSKSETNSPALNDKPKVKRVKSVKRKISEAPEIPRLPGKERFVSYFFVVGHGKVLEPVEPRRQVVDPLQNVYKAELLECFPNSNKEDPFPPHLWMFCLPKCLRLRTNDPGPSTYPFVLTSAIGDRLYGTALTFYETLPVELMMSLKMTTLTTVYAPKCICILSHWPYYSVFREWLYEMYKKALMTKLTIPLENYIINFVMEVPLPPPRNIKVKLSIGEKWTTISRSPATIFPSIDVPFLFLFKSLGISNVLTLFKCLLLEHKVLIYSKQFTMLSFACETAISLLYPFKWPHVYVPILPEILMDFVYSPTPYLMGVHSDVIPTVIEMIKADVILIDLDNNNVQVPFPIPDLPEPEASVLLGDLTKLLYSDMLSLDSPIFNPFASTTKSKAVGYQEINESIQCAFLKFFVSLFKDYRQFLMYVRVFPNPIAIFDSANFLELRPQYKEFFENFIVAQAFSSFLEEYNWPKENLFDEWIDNEVYKYSTEDIISKFSPSSFSKERFPEILPVPPPKQEQNFEPVEYKSWPVLNSNLLIEALVVQPIKIKADVPAITRHYTEKLTASLATPQDSHKAEKQAIQNLIAKLFEKEKLDDPEVLQLVDFFKFPFGRKEFGTALANRINGERTCISSATFDQIGQLLEAALRESNSTNDYLAPTIILHVVFLYYRIENGVDEYIFTRVRRQDIFQQTLFWEKAFFEFLSEQANKLYGNVRAKMEKWSSLVSKEKDSIVVKETDAVFNLLSSFAFNMVSLGVDVETIRRFMMKMCNVTSLDEERSKTLMQLVSNMTRASELIDETIPEVPKSPDIFKFKKEDKLGYLPIGMKAEKHESEGMQIFKSFLDEADEKMSASIRGKKKKAIRTSLLLKSKSKNKPNLGQEQTSEFREDYTVKTFQGHTEGVLCIVADASTLASGSCDGTIKLWNPLRAESIATLSGHSGWVNVLQLDGEGKLVSASYDRTVKLWDLNKQAKIHTLRGHKGSVSCLKLKDRTTILSGSYDNTLNSWDPRHYKKATMTYFGHTQPVTCCVIDGNNLLSGSRDTTLRLWDIRTGRTLKTFSGHNDWIKACRFDGDYIISGSCDSTVKIWNTVSGDCQTLEGHSGTINEVYSDSKTLCSASADGTAKLWDLNYGKCFATLEGHSDEIIACVPFQTNIATASYDTSIKIWDREKGNLVCTLSGHKYRVSSMIAFENKIITASWDKTVKLWEFPVDFRN